MENLSLNVQYSLDIIPRAVSVMITAAAAAAVVNKSQRDVFRDERIFVRTRKSLVRRTRARGRLLQRFPERF